MKNIIKVLKDYSKDVDIKKRFDFNFSIPDKIFNLQELEQLTIENSPFERNVKLKWILEKKYKVNTEQNLIDFWVINHWGGIKSFKQNERNVKKIRKFKLQLKKRKLTLDSFSTISSLSKISSFINPENFVIYDSRVIYTLNWLILTCENQDGLNQKYFPMPSGRNKNIIDFDINTILNISHNKEYELQEGLYINKQVAYFEFCDFIKLNTKLIYGEKAKPFELEMLLFILADKEIFNDLKARIKISIDNKNS